MSRLPSPENEATSGRRSILWAGAALVALLLLPIAAFEALNWRTVAACEAHIDGEGLLDGRLAWRITRTTCLNSATPFYDVAIGAEGKSLTTALTSHDGPIPLSVISSGAPNEAIVLLDRPRSSTGEASAILRLRKSGSAAERIDLQRDRASQR